MPQLLCMALNPSNVHDSVADMHLWIFGLAHILTDVSVAMPGAQTLPLLVLQGRGSAGDMHLRSSGLAHILADAEAEQQAGNAATAAAPPPQPTGSPHPPGSAFAMPPLPARAAPQQPSGNYSNLSGGSAQPQQQVARHVVLA